MQQEPVTQPKAFKPYTGPRKYIHVSPKRPCRICAKPDWCSYSQNEEVSFCARSTIGADAISKNQGWGIYFHTETARLAAATTTHNGTRPKPNRAHGPQVKLAPLEIRDAVYSELIRLSPVTNFRPALVDAESGLRARGFIESDLPKFGALPETTGDRARLARELRLFALANFRSHAEKLSLNPLLGIPGFWQDKAGAVQLWLNLTEPGPLLIIPYRDEHGLIQACQIRRSGMLEDGLKRYSWLATPNLRCGTSSGTPVHHTFRLETCPPDSPIIITEGALKAEAFFTLRSDAHVIATSGVTCSHNELILSSRNHHAFVGFDADHRENKAVCRHLGRLLAGREQDQSASNLKKSTRVITWERTASRKDKGIDDAALLNIPMRTISIHEWYESLTGEPKDEVDIAWENSGYRPS